MGDVMGKSHRIVFTGDYNTRSNSVNSLSSASGIVGIGIVGVMIVGLSYRSSDKDRRFINCFPMTVKDSIKNEQTTYCVKRPGFALNNTPSAGDIGTAIHVWAGQGTGQKVITAFGATNSTIYDGTSSLGAITGKATAITETAISDVANLAITSTDNTGWFYPDGGALTQITDAQFPGDGGGLGLTLAGTFAHLQGWAFIMDSTGDIYNSDLNSLSAWTAGNLTPTDAIPDIGVGIIRHRNTIVAFCKSHFEVFRNAGNVLSPLGRIEELTQLIGCCSADAITKISDTVFFAGTNKQGNISIYAYDGCKATPVSTPEIDQQFVLAGPGNIFLSSMGFYGRNFVIVLASNTTYVYCIEEKNWHEWNSTTPLWYKTDGVSSGATMVNYAITNLNTGGKVYVFNPSGSTYQDDSVAYSATVQMEKMDFGSSKRKFFEQLDILSDQETSTSDLGIFWSDDDYQTFTSVSTVDLSAERPFLMRLGSARRRAFKLVHSANTPMRLGGMEVRISEGVT